MKVRDAAQSAEKYANRGAAAAQDYARGVTGSGSSWQQATTAAEGNYEAGVQEAIGRKAFSKGVSSAGGAKYEQRAATVGAARYPQGVRDAAPEWQKGTAPYLQTLSSLTLPPRQVRGNNTDRVRIVNEALRRRKVGG